MLRLPTLGLALAAALGCSQATETAPPVANGAATAPTTAAAATVTTVALAVPGMT